jgi:peroxiredoxin
MRSVRNSINRFLPIALIASVSISLDAQVRYNYFVDFDGKRFSVDEKSIVKDSAGNVLPYKGWTELMQTGDYRLRPFSIQQGIPTEILIRKHSAQELIDMQKQMEAHYSHMPQAIKVGEVFEDFALEDIHGKIWKLSSLADKIIVLNFWFTGCAPCIQEIPELNALFDRFKRDDVVFLSLAMGDDVAKIQKFLERRPFNYNHIPYRDAQHVIKRYGIMAFPTHVVLNRDRRVTHLGIGYHEETVSKLSKVIQELL